MTYTRAQVLRLRDRLRANSWRFGKDRGEYDHLEFIIRVWLRSYESGHLRRMSSTDARARSLHLGITTTARSLDDIRRTDWQAKEQS